VTEPRSFAAAPVGVNAANDAPGYPSLGAYLTARLFPRRLDSQLAVRAARPAGSVLAIHAARLESDRERHAVARTLRLCVIDAHLDRPFRSSRIPVHRRNVTAAEDIIDMITLRLHSPRHVSATGMARLRLLLSDGCGPMYEWGRGDLGDRLRAAAAAL
jgi:hypothetical protein